MRGWWTTASVVVVVAAKVERTVDKVPVFAGTDLPAIVCYQRGNKITKGIL